MSPEHENRPDELRQAHDDLEHLLATTRAGVVFLDAELRIRRFTAELARRWGLRPEDVGGPLADTVVEGGRDAAVHALEQMMRTGRVAEVELTGRGGTALRLEARPQRADGRVTGAVLTLVDGESETARSEVAGGSPMTGAILDEAADQGRAEHQLRLQNVAIEAALNGVIIADATLPDDPIVYVNAGFVELTGYAAEEVMGRNCRFLQGPETDPRDVARLREAIARQEPCRVTLVNYTKDGTRFWNDLSLTQVRDESGRVTKLVGVQNDVTERVEAEVSAQRHAEQIQAILDTTSEGIYGVDREGRCTYCNRAALALLGYETEDEVRGRNMHALVHHTRPGGEAYPVESCPIYAPLGERATVHVDDEVFWRKDGTSFAVEYWSHPLLRDGEITGAVVSFQDLTSRLKIRSRLERMGRMIDASHDAIMLWDVDGGIVSWNAGATKLYGYTEEEARGRVAHELLATRHPIPWSEIYRKLQEDGEWVGVCEHRTKAGDWITVSTRHQLLPSSDGESHLLEIARDITEQKMAQEQLKRANRAARQASEAKSEFLANVSHELRTPMTAVLGFADILRLESDDPSHVEKVDTIKRNAEYLLALLNDILDLSKVEAGKMEIRRTSVDVRRVIEDVRSLMAVRATQEGIPLYFEWASHVPRQITGDEIRIRQILVNLIGNALKFTDEGEVRVTIGLERAKIPATLEIAVADTGIGITPEQQRLLFTPFAQAGQSAHRYGGTGLGLTISKRCAEGMGGSIAVESRLGSGSRFVLSLPVSPTEVEALVLVRPGAVSSQTVPIQGVDLPEIVGRILLADDRRDVWRVARFFLERCGAAVTIAEDGRQAVEAAEHARAAGEPFDLILMDMQMPIMTGREAIAHLRGSGFDVPIVALTADAMTGERESCLAMGCDEYVAKPIDGHRLATVVASLIRSRRDDRSSPA